jgi:DNA-binding NarL/FixJ family response regulator
MHADRIKIFLLDDHALFREGLWRLLAAEPGLEMVGHCGTRGEALSVLRENAVDMVLLDFSQGGDSAGDFIVSAKQAGYQGKFLLVTAGANTEASTKALRVGAAGVFLKHNSPEALVRTIRLVAAGHVWVDPKIIQIMADAVCRSEHGSFRQSLTEREKRVLNGVFEGLTNRRIGDKLGVSEATVKATLQELFQKAGVRRRSQLVRFALEGPMRAAGR